MTLISSVFDKKRPKDVSTFVKTSDSADPLYSLSDCLLGALNAQGGNAVISPMCLYQALAMISEAAGGKTKKQITDVLGCADEINRNIAAISSLPEPAYGCDNFHYSTGSSLWLSKNLRTGRAIINRTKHLIPIEVNVCNMQSDATVVAMEDWLSKNTGGVYSQVTKPSAGSLLVALSAICLRDSWKNNFEEGEEHSFTGDDGTKCTTDFMLGCEHYSILEREESLTVAKYLSGGSQMIISLPPCGTTLDEYISSGSAWGNIYDYMHGAFTEESRECDLYMPKFDISSDDLNLKSILASLGITDIFGANADFGPLTPDFVAVDSVCQNTRLSVDEQGLEGASYIEVVLCLGLPLDNPQEPRVIYIDRPFVVVVVSPDKKPLFVGTIRHVNKEGK
jgi:serpin B